MLCSANAIGAVIPIETIAKRTNKELIVLLFIRLNPDLDNKNDLQIHANFIEKCTTLVFIETNFAQIREINGYDHYILEFTDTHIEPGVLIPEDDLTYSVFYTALYSTL
jgi:hypothetical protein